MMVHKTTTHCLSPNRVQTLCKIGKKKKKTIGCFNSEKRLGKHLSQASQETHRPFLILSSSALTGRTPVSSKRHFSGYN